MRMRLSTSFCTVALSLGALALSGCTSDDEKMVRFEEELATAIDTNKNDCDAMAKALTAIGQSKGKDMQALKRKLAKDDEAKKALNARLDAKFGPRRKATEDKMKGGAKCLLTSDAVATAMLLIQGDGENQPDRAAPEKSVIGAPVTFVVDKVNPKSLDVSAYNLDDKTFAGFDLLIRYSDASGKVINPTPGMDQTFKHWSISGSSYAVPAKQWRSYVLDHLDTPAGATKAEILVTAVRARDGARIASEPTWQYKGDTFFSWPGARAAK